MPTTHTHQSSKILIRVLVGLIVVLTLGVGYYHNRWEVTYKQLRRLQLNNQALESISPLTQQP